MNQFATGRSDDVADLFLSDLEERKQVVRTLDGTVLIRRDAVVEIFSRMEADLDRVFNLFSSDPENKEYIRRKKSYRRVAHRIKADLGIEIPRMFVPAESEAKAELDKKVVDNVTSRRDPARKR